MAKPSSRGQGEYLLVLFVTLALATVALVTQCGPTHSDAEEPTPTPYEHRPVVKPIEGNVFLSGKTTGLGGVSVELLARTASGAWATVARCRTDPNGRFSLSPGSAPGPEYRIHEEDPEGFESTAAIAPAGGLVLDANSVQVVLPLMETDRVIFYDRRVEVSFAGYVYEHGTACGIAGVVVQLLSDEADDGHWKLLTTAVTGPDGSFILSECWDEDANYRVVECDPPGHLSIGAVAPQPGHVIGVNAVEYCKPPACPYTGIYFYDEPPSGPPIDEDAVCFFGRVLERGTSAGLVDVPVVLLRRRLGTSTWVFVASAATDMDGSFRICDEWSDGFAYQVAPDPLPGYRTVRIRAPYPGQVKGTSIRFQGCAATIYSDIIFWQRR